MAVGGVVVSRATLHNEIDDFRRMQRPQILFDADAMPLRGRLLLAQMRCGLCRLDGRFEEIVQKDVVATIQYGCVREKRISIAVHWVFLLLKPVP